MFIKGDQPSPDGDRPNLLVDGFPDTGAGSSDLYEIYGNFFYHNPREALLQALRELGEARERLPAGSSARKSTEALARDGARVIRQIEAVYGLPEQEKDGRKVDALRRKKEQYGKAN